MELKNIFKMTKTDRYTQDGRDELAKLQETEDVKYKTGDISQKTGLQKQPDGSWAPPKKGVRSGAGKPEAAEGWTETRMASGKLYDLKSQGKRIIEQYDPETETKTFKLRDLNNSRAPDKEFKTLEEAKAAAGKKDAAESKPQKDPKEIIATPGKLATQEQTDAATAIADKNSYSFETMMEKFPIQKIQQFANSKVDDFEGGIDEYIEFKAEGRTGVDMEEVGKDFAKLINHNVARRIWNGYTNGSLKVDEKGFFKPAASEEAPGSSESKPAENPYEVTEEFKQKAMENPETRLSQKYEAVIKAKGTPNYEKALAEYSKERESYKNTQGAEAVKKFPITPAENPDYPFKPKTSEERAERAKFEKDRDDFIERMNAYREESNQWTKRAKGERTATLVDWLDDWDKHPEEKNDAAYTAIERELESRGVNRASRQDAKKADNAGRNEFYRRAYESDAAPKIRQLTGDCRIRIRKEKPKLTGDTKIRIKK